MHAYGGSCGEESRDHLYLGRRARLCTFAKGMAGVGETLPSDCPSWPINPQWSYETGLFGLTKRGGQQRTR